MLEDLWLSSTRHCFHTTKGSARTTAIPSTSEIVTEDGAFLAITPLVPNPYKSVQAKSMPSRYAIRSAACQVHAICCRQCSIRTQRNPAIPKDANTATKIQVLD